MKAIKVTADERRLARKGGFKKKKPKKPKSRTETAISNYLQRYNDWAKEVKKAAKEGKRLDSLQSQIRGI